MGEENHRAILRLQIKNTFVVEENHVSFGKNNLTESLIKYIHQSKTSSSKKIHLERDFAAGVYLSS
jgi:hypothetical protein